MSNSNMVTYTKMSPNHSGKRTHAIDTITIHHMAGNLSVQTCGALFGNKSRQASSNYAVNGKEVGLYVDEANRSWCSSNRTNDQRAITIETANDGGAPDWHVSDTTMDTLIKLVADICKRNKIKKLIWSDNKADRINHRNGCNMTIHSDFAATQCPGPYLKSKMAYIASEVNKIIAPTPVIPKKLYHVQVGAYKVKKNADNMATKLQKDGYKTYIVQIDGLYKVQTGAFSVKKNADSLAKELKNKGYATYITQY